MSKLTKQAHEILLDITASYIAGFTDYKREDIFQHIDDYLVKLESFLEESFEKEL